MTTTRARTWFVTGAGSGIGLAIARHALEQNEHVVLTSRHEGDMPALAAQYPDTALQIALDVTDADQRRTAIGQAQQWSGSIDVLVNNAGIDFIGAIEEQREQDYRAQFEVNLFAAIELVRLALPGMRERRNGTIVNISSMDGIASLAANGYYSATKFALEGITEALRQEIEPIGLRAFTVQLGSFRTGIHERTLQSGEPIADYEATSGRFRDMVAGVTPEMFPGDPARAAAAILDNIEADKYRHWLVLGSDAQRLISARLDRFHAEFDDGADLATTTDYADAGRAVL